MILIGSDGPKTGLVEDERLKVLRQRQVFLLGAHINHVKPRLVAMHGVQNNLFGSCVQMKDGYGMVTE